MININDRWWITIKDYWTDFICFCVRRAAGEVTNPMGWVCSTIACWRFSVLVSRGHVQLSSIVYRYDRSLSISEMYLWSFAWSPFMHRDAWLDIMIYGHSSGGMIPHHDTWAHQMMHDNTSWCLIMEHDACPGTTKMNAMIGDKNQRIVSRRRARGWRYKPYGLSLFNCCMPVVCIIVHPTCVKVVDAQKV